MINSRKERGASPQDTHKRWIQRGLMALGAGAIYFAQGEDEKSARPIESQVIPSRHESTPTHHQQKTHVETLPEHSKTQTVPLSAIPLVREGFDVYDENRLSREAWKDEEAKRETLEIYRGLLAKLVVDQSDDAIHIYIDGAADPDLLVIPGQVDGSRSGFMLEEYGRPTFQAPEMDPKRAAECIELFVSGAIMHEAKLRYAETHGEQPVGGALDEYEYNSTSGEVERMNGEK